ncbi:hypothetical protein PV325_007363 [Microctonus aethiopoides]|nr:hypothetical protein PV325_007363 [Microctonus aethiopoides]
MIAISSIVAADAQNMYRFSIIRKIKFRHQFANTPFRHEYKDGLLLRKNQTFKNIVNGIEKHKKAIRFSDTIESTYVYLILGIFGLGIASISISGVQLLLYFNNPLEGIRYSIICLSYFVHIFYYTWTGQNILNHSDKIYDAAYDTEWYATLDKPTKLLITVILRSSKPCIQTAGKIFPLNLMSFSMSKRRCHISQYYRIFSNNSIILLRPRTRELWREAYLDVGFSFVVAASASRLVEGQSLRCSEIF